jgi:HrpA-like RNA helicase
MLPKQQFPQILLEDVSTILMDIINEQLRVKKMTNKDLDFNVADIDMLDVPSADALHLALEKLYAIGFISPIAPKYVEPKDLVNAVDTVNKFGITKLGAVAFNFSMIAPESIRMILGAYSWGCSILDMVTIASYIAISSRGFIGSAKKEGADDQVFKKQPKEGIRWVEIYKNGAPGYLKSPAELYKLRLLIADEFIDAVFLFNAVKHIIAQSESNQTINNLRAWCDKANLNYDTIVAFMKERDGIIEQMLTAGLDVFINEENSISNSEAETFMDTITRMKYCIYDGYRMNLIVKEGSDYYTVNGHLKLTTPTLFREDEESFAKNNEYGFALSVSPTTLLYRELSVKYNQKTGVYDVVVDRISAMDGFVNIDPYFTN